MTKFQWGIAALILCSLTVVILASYGAFDRDHDRRQVDLGREGDAPERIVKHQPLGDALGSPEDELVKVGEIHRPARDTRLPHEKSG